MNLKHVFELFLSYLCAFSSLLHLCWVYMRTTNNLIIKHGGKQFQSKAYSVPILSENADIFLSVLLIYSDCHFCWYSLATIFDGAKPIHWTAYIFFGRCVICLAEYEEKDVLRILPPCSHNFHMACIDLWLEQNTTCPVCRVSLLDIPDSEQTAPPPLPSVVISCPSSPESSRSDPCRCLFVSTGHSSRAPEAPRHEPDQENQVASAPSMDGANNMPLSEVNPPPENNNQTVRKQVDRSTQLGPCK